MSDDKKKKPMTAEELAEVLAIITMAYREAGRTLETATLYDEDRPEGEILVDNRNEEDIN